MVVEHRRLTPVRSRSDRVGWMRAGAPQPPQPHDREYQRDEEVPGSVVGPDGGTWEQCGVNDAQRANDEDAGKFKTDGQGSNSASSIPQSEGDGRDDVDHGGDSGKQVGHRGFVEPRHELHYGPRSRTDCEDRIDHHE